MKVIAFNGSPRKDGNTTILINHVLRELEKEGVETELVQLSEKEIRGCIACYKCFETSATGFARGFLHLLEKYFIPAGKSI